MTIKAVGAQRVYKALLVLTACFTYSRKQDGMVQYSYRMLDDDMDIEKYVEERLRQRQQWNDIKEGRDRIKKR